MEDGQRGEGGKLTEAARRWAGGDPTRRARRRFSPNLDQAALDDLRGTRSAKGAADTVETFIVHTSVWPHFDLFRRCERLWRYPAMGGPPQGLDWAQVRAIADALPVSWDTETLDLMQAMEAAASEVWTEEWKRKNPPKTTGR